MNKEKSNNLPSLKEVILFVPKGIKKIISITYNGIKNLLGGNN